MTQPGVAASRSSRRTASHPAESRPQPMDEDALRALIAEVRAGRMSRGRFVGVAAGLGLTAPLAAHLLGPAPARAQAPDPARRGGGGPLRLLYWQAPTILNPHLAVGVKDVAVIPIVWRSEATAVTRNLRGVDITPWGSNLWNLASWHRNSGVRS